MLYFINFLTVYLYTTVQEHFQLNRHLYTIYKK